jgi:hypothetical protein
MSELLLDVGCTVFIGVWLTVLWRMFCRSGQNVPALRVLCARFFFGSLVLALIVELTIFNWSSYLSLWADEGVVYNSKDFAEIQENDAELPLDVGIKLRGLDRKITSLHIDLSFQGKEMLRLKIIYKDEESTRRHDVTLYRFSPRSRYLALLPHGKVSEIGIYSDETIQIDSVTLNSSIPVKIFLFRIALLGISLFTGCLWINQKTKNMLMFFLFDSPVDATCREQKKLYGGMVFSFTILCLLMTLMSWTVMKEPTTESARNIAAWHGMTHIYPLMADALLKGQVHLDLEVSPDLLKSARPYDPQDRGEENGDFSYYQGKYYSYFGVVPVLLLFMPFKFLTGQDFPTHLAVFIFSAVTCLAFALLWREVVRRFMPHMPFFFYFLGGLSLMMLSGVLLLCRHPVAYELAIASTLMFLAFGVFLFIRALSEEKNFRIKFFLASLCFALAVGCRPTAIFMFALALLFTVYGIRFLQKNRSQPSRSSLRFVLICLVLPYVIVALPLMWYNYARFGAITDFGAFHQLTLANMKALQLANPIGKLLKVFSGIQAYFFNPLDFSSHFPFATLKPDFIQSQRYDATLPVYMFNGATVGLMNLPLLWFLFNIRRVSAVLRANDGLLYGLLLLLLGIGLLHILFLSLNAGILIRYSSDFLWLFTLAALICAYFTYRIHVVNVPLARGILKFIYMSSIASIVFCFFWTICIGSNNLLAYYPVYYYLQSLFSIL